MKYIGLIVTQIPILIFAIYVINSETYMNKFSNEEVYMILDKKILYYLVHKADDRRPNDIFPVFTPSINTLNELGHIIMRETTRRRIRKA